MSGLDKLRNISSEPTIIPTVLSEDVIAQTITARDLVVEGSVTFPDNYSNQSETYSFRNIIINGDARIDQRNSANFPLVGNGYSADRWFTEESSDAVLSTQQSTDVPIGQGFINSIKTTSTTANASTGTAEYSVLTYFIEGKDSARFAWGTPNAKTITASFWVKASVTGTYSFTLYNTSQSRINPSSYRINTSNTWEKKTITIPGETSGIWDTTTGRGIVVNFYTSLGSNYVGFSGWNSSGTFGVTGQANAFSSIGNIFAVTGLQIEEGSVATPFERRSIGTELALCQRYFQRLVEPPLRGIWGASNTYGRLGCPLLVQMRIAPRTSAGGSLTIFGSLPCWDGAATGTITSYGINYSTDQAVEIDGAAASGTFTQFRPAVVYKTPSTANYIDASAEL
jgi:hypothetical protein